MIDFQLIAHVTNQIVAVPEVASVKIGNEIRFWHVWGAIHDIVLMVDVAAVSCILYLWFVSFLLFVLFFALMFVAMKLAECYPHRIGTNNSFSTLQVRTVRLNVPGTVSEY